MDIKDQYIRNFLRIIAAIILMYYVFDFGRSKLTGEPVYLDGNDGLIIGGCVSILLAIEAVRIYVKRKLRDR